jgi:hypothetical protein
MAARKKSMRLNEHERQTLVRLYLRWRIPVDQYESRPDDLEGLCDEWRDLCRRTELDGEILHYMRNERKCGRWPVFNGNHQTAPPLPRFTADETELLIAIYFENIAAMGEGSDNIAYDGETAQLIARRFAEATQRIVPPHQLVAKVTAIRKRGLLPPVQKVEFDWDGDTGFTDINDIG